MPLSHAAVLCARRPRRDSDRRAVSYGRLGKKDQRIRIPHCRKKAGRARWIIRGVSERVVRKEGVK